MNKNLALLTLLTLSFSFNVFAAEMRGDIQPTMKKMGAQFKILATALIKNEETPAATVQTAADTLVLLLADAATKAPEQFRQNGAIKAGKEADIAVFDELIAKVTVEAKTLQAALKAGDRALATQIVREKMMPLMRDGHERFK